MDDRTKIDILKEKLHWYIYEANYIEYNEQEVNYILQYLKEHDSDNEAEYNNFVIVLDSEENKIREKNKVIHKSHGSKIIALAVTVTAASLLLSFSNLDNTLAGIKTGFFNFLEKDEGGMTFITNPDNNDKTTYLSFEDLPFEIQNIIWKPSHLNSYVLDHIYVVKGIFKYKSITSYFIKNDGNGFIEIGYTNRPVSDGVFKSSSLYGNINIRYHIIDGYIYRKSFTFDDKTYYILSDNPDIIDELIYDYVDYIAN